MKLTAKEISEKYNSFAGWYDSVESVPDFLGVAQLRRKLISRASGRVLEIAAGTGKNFRYYSANCQITAVDLSERMLAIARKRGDDFALNECCAVMDAQYLSFPNGCFDTVVSSLSTCTFPDPVAALKEMARVCRPDGSIFLLEHGRSDRKALGRWQDRHADEFAKPLGCHWNREPLDMIRAAGLKINTARRVFFGIFHQIEAAPISDH